MQISQLGYVNNKKEWIGELLYPCQGRVLASRKKIKITIPQDKKNNPWLKYHGKDEKEQKDKKEQKKDESKKDEKKENEMDVGKLIEDMRRWGC